MLARLINIKRMVADLRESKIKRGEYWCYAGLFMVGVAYEIALLVGIMSMSPEITYIPAHLEKVELGLMFVTTIFVTWIAYRSNTQGDNKDFWYRYLSLNFPVGITLAVIGFIIALVLGMFNILNVEIVGYPYITFQIGLYILYGYLIYKYMSQLSTTQVE